MRLTAQTSSYGKHIPSCLAPQHFHQQSCIHPVNTQFSLSFRFNLAYINDSDVGLKTDLVTINPSQIQKESVSILALMFDLIR